MKKWLESIVDFPTTFISCHTSQIAYLARVKFRRADVPVIIHQRLEKYLVGIALYKEHHLQ